MPIKKVTDPSVLQQLNAGNGVVAENPLFPAQQQKTAADAATATATAPYAGPQAAATLDRTRVETGVAQAKAPSDIEQSRANARQTEAQATTAENNLATTGGANEGQAKSASFYTRADRANRLYEGTGVKDQPVGRSLALTLLPDALVNEFTSPNRQTAEAAQRDFIAATLRYESGANIPQNEFELQKSIYFPAPGDSPQVIAAKAQLRQNALDGLRVASGPAAPLLDKPTESSPLPAITAPGQDQATLATGKTRDVIDPALKATGQRVGRMISQGVPDANIISFLQKSGVDPANTNVQQALEFRRSPDFKAWQKANPGQAYPIGPDFYTKQVPMTPARSLVNKAAANNVGGTALSAGAGAVNAILGDRLSSAVGAVTGEPETAKTGMALLAAAHPAADIAGNVAGQAAIEGMAGGVPGLAKIMTTPWGRRAFDAAYGGYYGSGDDSGGNAGTGALEGALVNTLGGMTGRGVQRSVGGLLTGVKNPQIQYLDNAGIPLTVGQIGHGATSVVGKAIGGIEDRAAGLPVFDAIINSARRRGEEGFNRAAFKEMGGSGATGAQGVIEGRNLVNNAYSFLDPLNIPLDAQFAGSQAGVRAGLSSLPKYGPEIASGLNVIDKASANGALTGRDWQQALRSVKSDRSSLKGKEFSQGGIDALGDVEENLLGLAGRQAPDSVQADLAKANDLNKQFNTITAALDTSAAQGRGELFSAKQLDAASRANARKFGGRTSSMAGDRPFYDLTNAGMDVMPNQVPDSGTAGRALLYSALFGSGMGGIGAAFSPNDRGGGAAKVGGLATTIPFAVAALYSKPGQKAFQKLLLGDRPMVADALGERLKNNPVLAGILGQAMARQAALAPYLPQ